VVVRKGKDEATVMAVREGGGAGRETEREREKGFMYSFNFCKIVAWNFLDFYPTFVFKYTKFLLLFFCKLQITYLF
jgi:hypothetical protein